MKFIMIFFFILWSVNAQAQLKGNGNISTLSYQIEAFNSIENGLSSQIMITIGDYNQITIKADKNLQDQIRVEVRNGVLEINQKSWISSSKRIEIEITTTNLVTFKNSAHGNYMINGIDSDYFEINANVGEITVKGTAHSLFVRTGVGTIDATDLMTKTANLVVTSFGKIRVGEIDSVDVNVSATGTIIYAKEPVSLVSEIESGAKIISKLEYDLPKPGVQYIDLALKNNSGKRVHIVIEGPENARFGYGLPFRMFQKRTERFPIGTKIYQVDRNERKELLLVIRAEDENQSINLFK